MENQRGKAEHPGLAAGRSRAALSLEGQGQEGFWGPE